MSGAALVAALRYAAYGWPAFPCRPGSKAPATRHGCLSASTDPDLIRRWWERLPDANVAIATGIPGPDVVDIDPRHGGDEAAERVRLVGMLAGASALVRTPSGGRHLYYAGSEQANGVSRFGIDFRSRGGYVLAPPSIVDGAGYVLVEHRPVSERVDWAAIRNHLDPPTRLPPSAGRGAGDLDSLVKWVAGQPEGNRNGGLYWAARRAVHDGHGDLTALLRAAIEAGLSEHEASRTIDSALRRGTA
jgi:hypothetical protein